MVNLLKITQYGWLRQLRMILFVLAAIEIAAFTDSLNSLEHFSDISQDVAQAYQDQLDQCDCEKLVLIHPAFRSTQQYCPVSQTLHIANPFHDQIVRIESVSFDSNLFTLSSLEMEGKVTSFQPVDVPPSSRLLLSTFFTPQAVAKSSTKLTVNTSIGIFEEYITGEGLAGEYRIKSWQELNVILPIDDTIEHQLKIFNPHDHALEILEASVTSDQLGLTAPELKNAPSWTIEPGDTKHVVTV